MTTPPFRKIAGRFYRTVVVERLPHLLDPPGPESAGRYPGTASITLSSSAQAEDLRTS